MGCFGSRIAFVRSCALSRNSSTSRQNSRRQNIFAVQNVDDTGQGVSPGKLEVTETDLVLHVKGKPSLTWPLRCLRRYGYDNDLFSFESGRRCPTGAGIFAFRCHRAQSLFNLLQAKIQGNPGSLPTVPSTPITPPNVPISSTNNNPNVSTPVSSTFVYVNLSESNSSRLLASSGAPVGTNQTQKPSSILPSTSAGSGEPPDVVQMMPAAASKSSEPIQRGPAAAAGVLMSSKPSTISENHPVYMNVESHGGALFAASTIPSSSKHSASNSNIPPPTAPRKILTTSSATTTTKSSELPLTTSLSGGAGATCASLKPKPSSECALYSNVFCNHRGTTSFSSAAYGATVNFCTGGGGVSSSGGAAGVPPLPYQEPAEINYAELDLKTDRPSSSTTNSPRSGKHLTKLSSSSADVFDSPKGTSSSGGGAVAAADASKREFGHPRLTQGQNNGDLGYATIDFDKTAQLSVITRSKITLGFDSDSSSSKKSRHGTTGL